MATPEVFQDSTSYFAVDQVTSIGMPRDHVAIFVETHQSGPGTGYIYQVSGNIQQGMFHNHRPGAKPEVDKDSFFVSKKLLGRVRMGLYDVGQFEKVCDALKPPPKQFDGKERMDPSHPLRRCGEWTEDAEKALREEGVLVDFPCDALQDPALYLCRPIPFCRQVMEHLPLVASPHKPLAVPYLGGEYSGQRFTDLLTGETPFMQALKSGTATLEELKLNAPFLQAWFLFGLIREVLDLPVISSDLVTYVGTEKRVTTVELRDYLRRWKVIIDNIKANPSDPQLQIHKDRVVNCLARSFKMWQSIPDFGQDVVGLEAELSIQLLACALENAVHCILEIQVDYLPWRRQKNNFLFARMVGDGWCPSVVGQLWNPCRLTWLYYVSLLGPPRNHPPQDHSQCRLGNGEVCQAKGVKNNKENDNGGDQDKVTKHVSHCGEGRCRTLRPGQEVPLSLVENIVEDGGIPILEYEDGQLHVSRHQEGMQYTAISHVWADGLGNPNGNTMPECQIERICKAMTMIPWTNKCLAATLREDRVWEEDREVMELSADPEELRKRPLLFWIDTICVPRGEPLRTVAATNMRAVYNRANRVLVFDAGLEAVKGKLCPEEILTRISISNWIRRFWTLQEAVLAKVLWFRFGDECYRQMSDGLDIKKSTFDNEVGYYCEDFDFNWRGLALSFNYPIRVSRVWTELKQRETTKDDDKINCIGTLLDMEVGKIRELQRYKSYEDQFESFGWRTISYHCEFFSCPGPSSSKKR